MPGAVAPGALVVGCSAVAAGPPLVVVPVPPAPVAAPPVDPAVPPLTGAPAVPPVVVVTAPPAPAGAGAPRPFAALPLPASASLPVAPPAWEATVEPHAVRASTAATARAESCRAAFVIWRVP